MKNVFFSIMVLFMLVASMLGDINIAKAESVNILVGDRSYNPNIAIKGTNQFVDVTFRVTNVDGDNTLDLEVVAAVPVSGQNSLLIEDPQDIIQDLAANGGLRDIPFRVSGINANTAVGSYTGDITVTEIDANGDAVDANADGVADNFKTVTYTINVQDSNPRLSVSGLSEDSKLIITSEEDQTKQKTFTIQNSGNVALNDLKLTIRDGTFTDGTEIIVLKVKFGDEVNFRDVILGTPIDMPDLVSGSSLLITIESIIPNNLELDTYSGNIVIADTTLVTSTVPFLIKIEPEICSDGRRSDSAETDGSQSGDLRISIDNPDNNDDFNILDEMTIEGDIENKGNKDLDVVVEAILYDLDDNNKVISQESDSIAVDNGQQESYEIIMTVPNDQDIDPDHTYILYVKASEDGDEDKYCNYDSLGVNLDRENDNVVINSFTINPTVAQQGNIVSFRIGTENIGTDEQRDSYIVVRNDELKLNLKSNVFDLKKYDKTENDKVEVFTFTIPADAVVKDYTIEVVVYYNNERDTASSFGTLTIQAKEVTEETTNTGTTPAIGTGTTGAGTYVPTKSIFSNLDSTKTLFIIGDIILVILAILFLILIFKKK